MTVAIHQPNYLPWMGFFDKMSKCDVFVILDDVQLPLGGHRYETQARIQPRSGDPLTLSVPVQNRGSAPLIKDTLLADDGRWKKKHLRSIQQAYGDSPCYWLLESILGNGWQHLSELNTALILALAGLLKIDVPVIRSSTMTMPGHGAEKIRGILRWLRADTYISGTGAGSRRYVSEEEFSRHEIKVIWHNFQGPDLSVVHSLCNGKDRP